MTEENTLPNRKRDVAVGESDAVRRFSASRAIGDEPRASPLSDFRVTNCLRFVIWVATRSFSSHIRTGFVFSFLGEEKLRLFRKQIKIKI